MRIISANERLTGRRGVKALVVGPTGVGKTSLLHTIDPKSTLFIDVEAGDLSVQDVPVDTIQLEDWPAARDLACRIGGPNPSYPPMACYSQAHYEAIGGALDYLNNLTLYSAIFILRFVYGDQGRERYYRRNATIPQRTKQEARRLEVRPKLRASDRPRMSGRSKAVRR
jgi:hypothetical protein